MRRFFMVPMPGLEPGRLTPLPPQDSVSTNSTTSAHWKSELVFAGFGFLVSGCRVIGERGYGRQIVGILIRGPLIIG